MGRIPILAIAGRSGSGTTYLAHMIQKAFKGSRLLSHDDYYRNDSGRPLFGRILSDESPEAYLARFKLDVQRLAKGKGLKDSPMFDLSRGKRLYRGRKIPAPAKRGVVIVEGSQVMNSLRAEDYRGFDVGIYIESPPEDCLLRRVFRDNEERNISPAELVATAPRMHLEYRQYGGEDQRELADLIVHNPYNPITAVFVNIESGIPQGVEVA